LGSFNEALRETVEELHVMRSQPLSQSVVGGTQTPGNLLNNPNPVIVALKQAIHTTLTREFKSSFYENIDKSHPVSVGQGQAMTLPTAWSIWVEEGGYHRPHVHPRGWYSSAYYVSLPGSLQATGRSVTDGNIAFGRPGTATPRNLEAERMIEPAEGILALFPSYFWHETLPFKGDEARVVVAFDAVPSNQ
ncbi:MAG: 2OG-Fe(II) oxygenase family protein, partial [Xanthomonadales bacterium]|nr:2OG-Fe(II) oxygenase family protein [Xanthomonadales bacterium]